MDIVIIGGGLAAANAARELRERGHEDGIVVLAAERHVPYERPPLSKGVLLGEATPDVAHVLEQQWYDEHDVDLRTGTEATAIDLDRRRVHAARDLGAYERLLIATGAEPRRLATREDSRRPGGLPAHHRRLRPSRRRSRRAPASPSSAPAGSASRPPPPPAGRRGRHRRRAGRAAAAAACSGRGRRRRSPTCTAATASTCASARRSTSAADGVVRLSDGDELAPT